MLSQCLKFKKNTESKNPEAAKTTEKIILSSKSAVCDIKKSRFIKKQEVSGLLSSLGQKTSLCKVPLLGEILFQRYKTHEIINKFLLRGDQFMSVMHLRQPGFTYSACRPFTKQRKNKKM